MNQFINPRSVIDLLKRAEIPDSYFDITGVDNLEVKNYWLSSLYFGISNLDHWGTCNPAKVQAEIERGGVIPSDAKLLTTKYSDVFKITEYNEFKSKRLKHKPIKWKNLPALLNAFYISTDGDFSHIKDPFFFIIFSDHVGLLNTDNINKLYVYGCAKNIDIRDLLAMYKGVKFEDCYILKVLEHAKSQYTKEEIQYLSQQGILLPKKFGNPANLDEKAKEQYCAQRSIDEYIDTKVFKIYHRDIKIKEIRKGDSRLDRIKAACKAYKHLLQEHKYDAFDFARVKIEKCMFKLKDKLITESKKQEIKEQGASFGYQSEYQKNFLSLNKLDRKEFIQVMIFLTAQGLLADKRAMYSIYNTYFRNSEIRRFNDIEEIKIKVVAALKEQETEKMKRINELKRELNELRR